MFSLLAGELAIKNATEGASAFPRVVLTFVVAYGLAVAVFPLLTRLHGLRRAVGIAFGIAIFTCPLIIPSEKIVLRALICVVFADLGFKVMDYARPSERRDNLKRGRLSEYARFLVPFPTLLVVFQQWRRMRRRSADRSGQISRIAIGLTLFSLCAAWLKTICLLSIVRGSYFLEHIAHLMLFVVAIESLSQAQCGIERCLGYDTSPIIRFAFLSRTVGEFWRRYNTRIHSWMIANVFATSAVRRSSAVGIWLTFLISGIQHELGFGIATSRFDGFQFAFFTLQAPGVLLSHALDRYFVRFGTAGKAASRAFTILWFAVTSPLFFHGVNRVFKVYCSSGSQ